MPFAHIRSVPFSRRTAALLTAIVVVISALSGETVHANGDLRSDVLTYMGFEGVNQQEAERRLALQDGAGVMEKSIRSADPDTFAGLWLQHRPAFRMVVAFTKDESASLSTLLRGTSVESIAEHRLARYSLRQLEADIASLEWLSKERVADLLVDVRANRVEVRVTSARALADRLGRRAATLPPSAHVTVVPRLATPTTDLYGGLKLDLNNPPAGNYCTSGFGVVNNGTADRGIVTAAHCPDSVWYGGTALTFQSYNGNSNHDEQWHTGWQFTIRNWVKDPSQPGGTRSITSRTPRSSQIVGGLVCHYGQTTGYGCGYIQSKNSTGCLLQGGTEWIYVQNNGLDLASGGDSGGPWFKDNSAHGIASCEAGASSRDAIYVAVDYVESGLGVTVLTAP